MKIWELKIRNDSDQLEEILIIINKLSRALEHFLRVKL